MDGINELLIALSKYGKPHIFCSDNKTWSCTVEFSFKLPGIETSVKSGYGHKTPLDAVLAVKKRLEELASATKNLESLIQLEE